MTRRAQRGATLLEGLIAIAVLGFGVLGLARFQAGSIALNTDAQAKLTAAELADELLAHVHADPANVGCYLRPVAGACASAFAQGEATQWASSASARMAGLVRAHVTTPSANTVRVELAWRAKDGQTERVHGVTTDVRP